MYFQLLDLFLPSPSISLQTRENLGTVLISLCYSPDTKKLGVIILRAKDLNKGDSRDTGETPSPLPES